MQVSSLNEVKIYSLSCGKSLPEVSHKRRGTQQRRKNVRRRIELIQDFEMPTVCTTIKVSKDGQYILATGKRLFGYDFHVLFTRKCFVTFEILSDDYSKVCFIELILSLLLLFCVRENNVCDINSVHGLFATGTIEGRVECWDPRTRNRVGLLDCALNSVTADSEINSLPTISALKFSDALTMAVGTSTGQGKIFTSLEPEHDLNDVCLYPNSGMLLTANETPKMGIYYIPVLGPAPRWCSFLDNLTEELEENPESTVYDDYKFVTKKDLENLGLTHLIGSPFLRAYMHGFFMDIRLYHKVKLMVNPFAYEEYRKDKIRQKIEETRAQRVQLKKLPKVNKELALKLIEEEEEKQKSAWKKKVKSLPNILTDDRFKVMFENPDFQVDEESEEFRLLNPLVSKISEKRKKKLRLLEQQEHREKEEEEEPEGKPSDAESSESSDDEKAWVEEVRKQRRLLQQEEKVKRQERLKEDQQTVLKPQFYEIKAGEEFRSFKDSATKQKLMNKTLEDRLKIEAKNGTLSVSDTTVGSKQLTFTLKRSEQQKKQQEAEKLHRQERKRLRRSAGHLKSRHGRRRSFH
uniref:Nucleolar protein 10 n=1 Tax=Saimiri boliviensis boliviensis TaxID=39432 RepID=A0A2K6TEL7_SAIBB